MTMPPPTPSSPATKPATAPSPAMVPIEWRGTSRSTVVVAATAADAGA